MVSQLILVCLSVFMVNQDYLPNASFESGKLYPDSWSLSGGAGVWEEDGYDGKRSISVTGSSDDSNYWKCDDYKLLPGQMYRVSFMVRVSPNASGGTVIAGSNVANRDFSAGAQWKRESFVFTTPDDTANAFIRFGQWQKSGKVWFDDIELNPVVVVHREKDNVLLGSGELIQEGIYTFRADLQGEGSNSSRPLFSHTAGFNSNRWAMGSNEEVIYHHKVGNYKQKRASATIDIGYYQSGKCTIEASNDGKSWGFVGELSELSHKEFAVPEELFSAPEIFIRLKGSEKDGKPSQLQIHGYTYNAELDCPTDMTGNTRYLEIPKSSSDLDVKVNSLGDLMPGGDNSARLSITNRTDSSVSFNVKLSLNGAESADYNTETIAISSGKTKDVSIGYEIRKSGDFELLVSVVDTGKKILYESRTFFNVPQLYAADYGYLLTEGKGCSVWWAEGAYKISKERPLPAERGDNITISAARNEYEPFQIVLKPDQDMNNVSVKMSSLTNPDGWIIPEDNIDIALVGYVKIKVPTDRIGYAGYWPDPLPPYKNPFSIHAGENQPVWITIHVPPDAQAGIYSGKLTVSSGSWSQKIDVFLRVWDFSLPKETHVKTAFGFSPWLLKKYHRLETDEELRSVVHKYYENFAAHRISPYDPMSLDPMKVEFTADPVDVKIDFSDFDRSARQYLDGLGFNSFRLPIRGMGGGTFHSRHLGEIAGYKQGTEKYEELFTRYLSQIQDHLESNGRLDKAYVYWFDEPEPKDYQFVKDGMDLIHRAAPKITRFLTEQPEPELYGSVETWCPVTPEYNYERAEERRKAGEHFWWYVCTGPKEPYCTLFIDHYATELRLWLWQTWKYRVEGILVWQSNYWTSSLAYPEPSFQDPYADPMSYVSGYGNPVGYIGYWGNGDGRFIYPPVEKNTKSLSGPVNSIRWEMLREGIEDYEYFWLLAEKIKQAKKAGTHSALLAEAEELLNVPEIVVSSMTDFTINPKPVYAHREKIAGMIEKLR